MTTVLICSPLEPRHVDRIRAVDPSLRVLFEPDLLPAPRYVADHKGIHPTLDAAGTERWRGLLASADVCFDFDWWQPRHLIENAPALRWVQGTSSGIGQFVHRCGLDRAPFVMTTAAGVHAAPLAEFAAMSLLHFAKDMPHLSRLRRTRTWERYTSHEFAGTDVTVVGLGGVGTRTVATLAALGARVTAVGRPGRRYDVPGAVSVVPTTELDDVLGTTQGLVLCTPLTQETHHLIDARRLAALPRGAVVVNIARGGVVDEAALVAALRNGHIGGAAVDVTEIEPLPTDSPLWELDNVIVSPHSASTVTAENDRILDIFTDNLRRWLDERELVNVYDPQVGY